MSRFPLRGHRDVRIKFGGRLLFVRRACELQAVPVERVNLEMHLCMKHIATSCRGVRPIEDPRIRS
jgi:hypothetical protein